jgi:hypothetical protein
VDELFPAEQARIVHLLVERVDVRMHSVEVRLRPNGLARLVREVAGSRSLRRVSMRIAALSTGAGMSTSGKDKSGRTRVRCSARTESDTCPDAKTFYLATIEKAVLSGLKAELKHPASWRSTSRPIMKNGSGSRQKPFSRAQSLNGSLRE